STGLFCLFVSRRTVQNGQLAAKGNPSFCSRALNLRKAKGANPPAEEGLVHSNPTTIIVIAVVVAAIAVVALLLARRNRTAALQRRFGKEYDRTVTERGSEREAQAVLEQREKRVASFNIRKLSPAERDRYAEAWRVVQSRFVDDPKGAVIEADDT